MKKLVFRLGVLLGFAIALPSCSGCVKDISKKATELSIEALEGVAEAVDEHGERIGEKTTNAAGKLIVGVGRSLNSQLEAHAEDVGAAVGKTTIKTLDGLVDGLDKEMKTYYDELPFNEVSTSGITLTYLGKHKKYPVIDSYFTILEDGKYSAKYDFYDSKERLILTKNVEINSALLDGKTRKHTLVSFALDTNEELNSKDTKEIKVTITK